MTSSPFDLPTLRHHYGFFTINDKQIPILYRFISKIIHLHLELIFFYLNRLKSGIYYPYIAYELVADDLDNYCSTWNTSKNLPLSPLTLNERLFYKTLCPKKDFSNSSKLILCAIIDQFLQLIDVLKDSKANPNETNDRKFFARFSIDIQYGSIPEVDLLNLEATTKYRTIKDLHQKIMIFNLDTTNFVRYFLHRFKQLNENFVSKKKK